MKPLLTILFLALIVVPRHGLAWGGKPHQTITKAVVRVLPAWQQGRLGDELAKLADSYCLILTRYTRTRRTLRSPGWKAVQAKSTW